MSVVRGVAVDLLFPKIVTETMFNERAVQFCTRVFGSFGRESARGEQRAQDAQPPAG